MPLGLAFTATWAAMMAFVLHVTANPVTFRLWLIVIAISVLNTFGFELIVRSPT